ncbi:hypothetical protein Tco_0179884 [Tanacetum coccineum]
MGGGGGARELGCVPWTWGVRGIVYWRGGYVLSAVGWDEINLVLLLRDDSRVGRTVISLPSVGGRTDGWVGVPVSRRGGAGVEADEGSNPGTLGDGVAGNCEFTREEWDAPYRPTFGYLTKEVFKDPAIFKTIVNQFPTPGEMVRVEGLSDDQLTTKMSIVHRNVMSHVGDLPEGLEEKVWLLDCGGTSSGLPEEAGKGEEEED